MASNSNTKKYMLFVCAQGNEKIETNSTSGTCRGRILGGSSLNLIKEQLHHKSIKPLPDTKHCFHI